MAAPQSSLQRRQVITFVLTWVAYASSYLLRKPLGVVKSNLADNMNLTKIQLGWLDTCFLLPYCVMQLLLSNLGDKYGPRLILSLNLLMAGLSMSTFGFWENVWVLGFLLLINGAAQATCWPNCVKALSSWYTPQQSSTIFGIFGTCTFAGGIFGTALAVQLQSHFAPSLKMVFFIPSLCVLFVAALQLMFLRTAEDMGVEVPGKELPRHVTTAKPSEAKSPGMMQLWNMRMLPEIAITCFCMKLVRYCLYMWLPMYLHQNLSYTPTQAGMFSTTFEIGGVVGSACMGIFISKIMRGRTYWAVFVLLASAGIFLSAFHITSHWGKMFNMVLIFLAGVCNCGPDAILGGTIAVEIGGRENAQSAVSGFINGFGSIGTVLEGPLIGFIAEQFGWGGTFYFMIVLSFLCAVAMLRATRLRGVESS